MSFGKFRKDGDASREADKTGARAFGSPGTQAGPSTGISSSAPGGADTAMYLGKGCRIVGNLGLTGSAEIYGNVEGEIYNDGRLTIGETGIVTGKIACAEIIIHGVVNGDIKASKTLALKRTAKLTGNVSAAGLSIEEGAIFEGRCTMNAQKALDGQRETIKVDIANGEKGSLRETAPLKEGGLKESAAARGGVS